MLNLAMSKEWEFVSEVINRKNHNRWSRQFIFALQILLGNIHYADLSDERLLINVYKKTKSKYLGLVKD